MLQGLISVHVITFDFKNMAVIYKSCGQNAIDVDITWTIIEIG